MQNLKNYEKSKGVVVFAFNTKEVDYVAIADQTSRLTAHTLGLPVTLITDHDSRPLFNYHQIIRVDPQGETFKLLGETQRVSWRNFGRYLAYFLSPYNETVLIDTDLLVLDTSLLTVWGTEFDYKLMHHNKTPAGACQESMGEVSLSFVWATVVLFRKTLRSELLFNLVGRIQRNYHYYRRLYHIREKNYRNDYAFAIANNIINGYCTNESQGIPWCMFTIEAPVIGMQLVGEQIRIYHSDVAVVSPKQNIHVQDKQYLQSRDFANFVEAIIEST
jgi:hypothetical protein